MFNIRNLNIPQLYFRGMWILALVLYIVIPLKSTVLNYIYLGIVIFTILSFAVVYANLIIVKKETVRISFKSNNVIFMLIIAVVALSMATGSEKLDIERVTSILGYLEMFMAIIIVNHMSHSDSDRRFVFIINILISAVFIVLSRTKYAYSGVLDSLYLGYANPNQTAIFLFMSTAILTVFINILKSKILKAAVIGLCLYNTYLLYLTNSRTCIVTSVILLVFAFAFGGKKIKIPKFVIFMAVIFPLIFMFVYTYIYSLGEFTKDIFLGKSLFSGRETYYMSQLVQIQKRILIGDAAKYYFTNMHNGPLAIIASSGVIGYILYLIFYIRTIFLYYTKPTRICNVAVIAILSVFLHSSTECAMVVGGAHYSIIVATFYWILNDGALHNEEKRIE